MKMSKSTIIRYLKQGVKLNWCDYNPKIALTHKEYQYKKVICLNTNEIFNSQIEASNKYNIKKTSISACCRNYGYYKSAGKHPITGERLKWMYYDKYLKQQK
jgi:hypothetical protein